MRIFLIIPFAKEFEDIRLLIKDVVESLGHQLVRADGKSAPGTITQFITDEIINADLIIADISSKNANVMFELGFANSSRIPVLPICQRGETMPFDIISVRSIIYDRQRLHETLAKHLRNFLSHSNFESFFRKEVSSFAKIKETKKTVFVSYSHADFDYLNRLKVHLKPFEKNGLIDLWEDTRIKAGEKWKEKIEKALDKAAIAILLISADFLASDFIIDNELPPLLKDAEKDGKLILPVILKPCRFVNDKHLSQFQAINDPKMPLSKLDENGKEEIYVTIANRIDEALK